MYSFLVLLLHGSRPLGPFCFLVRTKLLYDLRIDESMLPARPDNGAVTVLFFKLYGGISDPRGDLGASMTAQHSTTMAHACLNIL